MLYSETFCLRNCSLRQPLILVATLVLSCQLGIAQANDLIGTDMGITSNGADNNLIDSDAIAPPPTQPTISPAEAAELVRNKVGGQVMSVNTQEDDSGIVYGVKVLNAGRMRVISVDAQTGQVLNQ